MKKSNGYSGSEDKLDRKTIEKNRRIHMKALCLELTSLIPPHHFKPSKELLSQHDQLGQTATYISKLRERVEELKEKRNLATRIIDGNSSNSSTIRNEIRDMETTTDLRLAIVEVREIGSSLEIVLVSGLEKKFMLSEIVRIIEEGGAEVVTASYTTVGDKIYHSLHAQARVSRVGVEILRVYQRLQDLIC